MRIAIGNDHAATALKFEIMEYVKGLGHEVVNFGTDTNESCNYPEIGARVGHAVVEEGFDCGIMISASHNPYNDNGIKLINYRQLAEMRR